MESERERLGQLYHELGDEHLRDLADEPDELTDDARLALADEMRRRGFAPRSHARISDTDQEVEPVIEPERESGFTPGIPGVFPASAAVVEQALEPSQSRKDGLSSLIAFFDGIELSNACAALEEAGMEPVIEPIAGDAMSGAPPRYEVWLESSEIEPAKALLRTKMGLFPLAESATAGDEALQEDGRMVVGQFESAREAEDVRAMLAREGFRPAVESDSDDPALSLVLVPAREQERAVAVLAQRLGLQ